MSNNRRRSMSVSTVPYSSQSDTTASISSSLWNSNKSTKSNFLSRFKSPNATPPTIVTPSKSTSTNIPASLPPIHGQQKIKRKPIVSQQTSGLSASLSPTTTSSGTTTATSRKKYEALLGIRTEDLISENLNSKKKSNGNNVTQTAKGFGNIFKKKRSKSLDKKVNGENISALFYNTHKQQPQEAIDPSAYGSNKINVSLQQGNYVLPPISQKQHHVERQENALNTLNNTKIIYTSPIKTPIVNQSMGDKPVILANNHVYKPQYHQYEVGEQPSAYSRSKAVNDQLSTPNPPMNDAARWSTASTQKSTGSCSIYSTFESESIYGANDSSDNVNNTANTSVQLEQGDESSKPESINADYSQATDLVSIVASNVQTRNPARLVVEKPAVHEDIEDENDSSYEDDDDLHDKDSDYSINRQSDVFVDATDISLEELEREKIEARLSKRLSGGHFGSAGGLMISILASSSTETKAQRRTNRPPPEDVVQSMMNWKRHSGHGTTKYVMPDQQPPQQHANEQQSNKSTVIDDKDISPSPLPPTVPEKYTQPVMPQRPLPPNPNILLTTTQEAENEGDDDEEKEKSIPIESIEPAEHSDDPKQCASRLWDEDESFVQRERIAEWLGQSKELNANTLYEYLNYFDFATMRLDSAFRKVCSKLYFRAEAQQIDRILEAFAKRYWQCNPKTIFGSADIVYAVVYSLLLLNTDLHVAQGNYTRMTRQAFVKNTMSTINDQQKTDPKWAAKKPNFMLAWEAHIEAYLKDMYISVKNYQILQPMQNNMDDDGFNVIEDNSFLSVSTSTSNKRMSIMGGKRMIDIKRSLNTMIHKSSSTRESMLFLDEPSPRKSSSSNTRQQQYPTSPHSSKSIHSTSRRNSFSSSHSTSGTLSPKPTISSNASQLSPNQSHMMNFMDTHAADLFANRPPYLKEGVVMRKHLLESANQKAKHREWRECLLVVGQGELKMYGLQSENASDSNSISSGRRNVLRASSASFANLADTLSKNYQNVTNNGGTSNSNVSLSYGDVAQNNSQRWATYSQLIGSVELNHSLSNALPPPGYNKSRPHVFAIQEPNGGVYLIQATSNEQVVEWVSTCNYWAARQSKEPLQGGVGNLEYGWGSCLDDVILDLDAVESGEKITGKYIHDPDAINLSHWIPPAPTMVSSILDEKAQFESLQTYVNQLNEEINEHREIKQKIIVKFQQKGQNHSRAFANWESKSKYMLHEIIKYQNYCDSLEKSIQSREIEEEDAAARESNPVIN